MLNLRDADILFLETSALTGEGVEEAFIKVARMILNKIEDGGKEHSLLFVVSFGFVMIIHYYYFYY